MVRPLENLLGTCSCFTGNSAKKLYIILVIYFAQYFNFQYSWIPFFSVFEWRVSICLQIQQCHVTYSWRRGVGHRGAGAGQAASARPSGAGWARAGPRLSRHRGVGRHGAGTAFFGSAVT